MTYRFGPSVSQTRRYSSTAVTTNLGLSVDEVACIASISKRIASVFRKSYAGISPPLQNKLRDHQSTHQDETLPNSPLFNVRPSGQLVESVTQERSEQLMRIGIGIPSSR